MKKDEILDKLLEITHQPFLIFVNEVEEKTDNAFETLKLLAAEENVTAGRISEMLDIKPSSVTQIIKKLEEAGTARREKSGQDSRVTIVKITDKGHESLKERSSISTTLKDVLFQGFAEDELEMLDQYLERMVSNISSEAFQDKLLEVFSNDKRWELFGKMSARFGRAREQMLERSGFGGFGGRGFMGGGFDGWKKGRKR
ncbi:MULTISPECIES: MarR family winged helix-turn-helix transcriptional regulator [unclassified Heyndrickxia]|uniref:MarR family winged helix-turn-helix transcriptional regulator n=1 Tax=unclassified Heyndrickxia TaxID=2837518 RepID=UPI002DBE5323|nr:MarR family transcriptional regulator [Weizmannia sp. CD-2023]MEC2224848.1 MarR family transcriptional regulator [Weizmannia sp. CD-2023]MED4921107.1 MarR family transcriptional regulator [Weizmannia sp. CD-2023]